MTPGLSHDTWDTKDSKTIPFQDRETGKEIDGSVLHSIFSLVYKKKKKSFCKTSRREKRKDLFVCFL